MKRTDTLFKESPRSKLPITLVPDGRIWIVREVMKRFLPLVGLALVAPFFMSRRSRVVRNIWIYAEPSAIYPHLNRTGSWLAWAFDSAALEIEGEGDDQLAWTTTCGEFRLEIIGGAENRHIGYALEINGHPFEGVITLVPLGSATRVLWAGWWVGDVNPYCRYVDLAIRWRIGRMFERGLQRLRTLVETEADPFDPAAQDAQWNVS